MKKTRTSAAVALALTGVLALSACSPPNENNSDKKVDTATTGPASPSIATTKSADSHSTGSHEESEATGSATATTDAEASQSANPEPSNSETANSTMQNDPEIQVPAGVQNSGSEPAQGAFSQ